MSTDESKVESDSPPEKEIKLDFAAHARILKKRKRTKSGQEKSYDKMVKGCIEIPGGHQQKEPDRKNRLYTITTMASSPRFGGNRTPVICDNWGRANQIVLSNACDIWEYSYMIVVVEAVLPNELYGGFLREQYWYKWFGPKNDMASGGYRAIEIPKDFENTSGFGIG